jgi:hypothetical protein
LQIIAKDGPKRYSPPNSSQGANPKTDGEIQRLRHISISLAVCVLLFSAFLLNIFAAQDFKSAQQTATASLAAPREFHAEPSAQRLARGKYLVEGTAQCFQCHSQPDFEKGFGQPMPGTEGAGQFIDREEIDQKLYPEGIVCPNITPDKETGAGTWTDAQFEQAIRHGIGHDGRNLIRFMPYSFFRSMTDEDVASVIVYLRSIPAVKNVLPKMKLGFEVKTDMRPEMELMKREMRKPTRCSAGAVASKGLGVMSSAQTSPAILRESPITTRRCSSRPSVPAAPQPECAICPPSCLTVTSGK